MMKSDSDFLEQGDFIEQGESTEQKTMEPIPVSRVIVGIAESIITGFIKDERQRQEILLNYERATLPVLDMIQFDDAFSRKFLTAELSDETIIGFGLGYLAIQTIGIIFLVRKGGAKNDNNEQGKGDDKQVQNEAAKG